MISLTCTSCKKVLQIDDAFAGGVCRCQHCGTIQTVPSSLKRTPAGQPTGAKTLYKKKTPPSSNAGNKTAESLPPVTDATSPAATASGRTRAAAVPVANAVVVQAAKRNVLPIAVTIGVVGGLLVALLAWLAFR